MQWPTLLLALASLIVLGEAINYRDILTEEWNAFKTLYRREYGSDEEEFRFKVFMENKHMIAKHNQKAAKGQKSYTLDMNHYGDLLHHEFVRIMNGYQYQLKNQTTQDGSPILKGSLFMTPEHVSVPTSVDWRQRDMVTPVKNQGNFFTIINFFYNFCFNFKGQCGSCWSFSAVSEIYIFFDK